MRVTVMEMTPTWHRVPYRNTHCILCVVWYLPGPSVRKTGGRRTCASAALSFVLTIIEVAPTAGSVPSLFRAHPIRTTKHGARLSALMDVAGSTAVYLLRESALALVAGAGYESTSPGA